MIDEAGRASGEVARLYEQIRGQLLREGNPGLQRLRDLGHKWMRDVGIASSSAGDQPDRNHVMSFDPYPRILGTEDWALLERGVQQRMAIWNALLKDIYSTQEVLKAGILPVRWVYDDPQYHRGAVGVAIPGDVHAPVAAFDVVRRSDGTWSVVKDHLAHPTGAIYAMQSRVVFRQVCPGLVDAHHLLAAEDYPARLMEHLRRHAPSAASEPRVVLLSPGPIHPAYSEHTMLARQMGIPVVQGSDLIVVNSRVHLKTIGGLEPIDVIHRGLDETSMDPLEFAGGSQQGVAGLMNCVRKGSVAVNNAFGAGLGDNRSIPTRMAQLAKFYLNEPLLLPTIERFVLDDPDQLEHVAGDLPRYAVFGTASRSTIRPCLGRRLNARERAALLARIRGEPAAYVAEPLPLSNCLPCVTPQGLETRAVGLRLFAFGGRLAHVAPCALTRFGTAPDHDFLTSDFADGIKDTWILCPEKTADVEEPIRVSSGQRRLRLGSRTADSLYWIGRYSERADNITRILQVLVVPSLTQPAGEALTEQATLREALARATGHSLSKLPPGQPLRRQNLTRYFLSDASNPASVRCCLRHSRENARQIRGAIPPEVWRVLDRLDRTFHGADASICGQADLAESAASMDAVLRQLDELTGAVQKNMLHGDQWHFWSLGVAVERALNTLMVMRPILVRRPHPVTGEWRREEHHLDALLGMLASRYAYRSLYQSRPTPENVARLLLLDEQVPRSVLCCLQTIRRLLLAVTPPEPGGEHREQETPLKLCGALCSQVEYADLQPFFEPEASRPRRLRAWLDQLAARVARLSTLIGDHYLIHQAFNILR